MLYILKHIKKNTLNKTDNNFIILQNESTIWMLCVYCSLDSYMMYTDNTGTITPPLYRGMYPHNANITYSITRPQNEPIFLTFPNFELQEAVNGTCLDFIQVNLQIHTWCPFLTGATKKRLPTWLFCIFWFLVFFWFFCNPFRLKNEE